MNAKIRIVSIACHMIICSCVQVAAEPPDGKSQKDAGLIATIERGPESVRLCVENSASSSVRIVASVELLTNGKWRELYNDAFGTSDSKIAKMHKIKANESKMAIVKIEKFIGPGFLGNPDGVYRLAVYVFSDRYLRLSSAFYSNEIRIKKGN